MIGTHEWLYLPTGRTAHAVYRTTGGVLLRVSSCGLKPGMYADWCGVASRREWEKAQSMPRCARCYSFVVRSW